MRSPLHARATLVQRLGAVAAGVAVAAFAGCNDSPSEPVLGDSVVVQNATLDVLGGADADDIRITVEAASVRVQMGAASGVFDEAIQGIRLRGGAGNDVVRIQQSVVRDIELDIAGGEGDDDVQLTLAPSGTGTAIAVTARIDGGAGSDVLGFSWDSTGEDLDALVSLTVASTVALPEVDDEVLVELEAGDPDQPIIVGSAYNPSGPGSGSGEGYGFTLTASLTDQGPDVEVGVRGDIGRDELTVEADYSGVLAQQGRVAVDADVGEGDNYVGTYFVTGVTHTLLETSVVGGGGANTIVMEDQMGGDVERVYDVRLGDGDNSTSIVFGDGIRGRRPSTGTRTVTGSYRSGAGTNGLLLSSDLVEPLTSDFTLDFGEGQGSIQGRFDLPADPASDPPPPGSQGAPSQIKVLILSPNETDWDFVTTMADPWDADGADEPGKITLVGTGARGGRLDFLRLLDPSPSPDGGQGVADDWTIALGDLDLGGPLSVTGTANGAVRRLVYLQEQVQIDAGASLDVTLQGRDGADAMLAHLLGLSGDGAFELVVDGGAGADFGGALTGGLDPTGTGALTFDTRTGDGDDQAAMEAPTDAQRGGPVTYLIDAGAGTDACWASNVVATQGCESREGITAELLQTIEALFGAELAAAWGGGS